MKEVWVVSQCWDYEGCDVVGVFDTEEKAEEYEATLRRGLCYGPKIERWELK